MSEVNRDELLKRLNKYGQDKIFYLITIYSDIYNEISFETLANKIASGEKSLLEPLRIFIENLIIEGKLNVKIKDDLIVFQDEVATTLDTMEVKKSSLKYESKSIKANTKIIDAILNNVEDLDRFLKEVASYYERIKFAYEFYKEGRISKEELIAHALKVIGNKILKGFI